MSHTPGPWTTDLRITTQAGRVAIEPDIAVVYVQPSRYDGSESKRRLANARLIAAAPELLERLKAAVERQGFSNKELIAARATIAKAEGTA
jgi:hypothetical protein